MSNYIEKIELSERKGKRERKGEREREREGERERKREKEGERERKRERERECVYVEMKLCNVIKNISISYKYGRYIIVLMIVIMTRSVSLLLMIDT